MYKALTDSPGTIPGAIYFINQYINYLNNVSSI